MKRNLVALSLVAVLTLMASFGFAGAGVRMQVSVPFNFYVGSQLLPAGEYEVQMASGSIPTTAQVTIMTADGVGICILNTRTGSAIETSSNHLRFNQYGNKHFLAGVSIEGFNAALKMQKLERELRAQAGRVERTLISQK